MDESVQTVFVYAFIDFVFVCDVSVKTRMPVKGGSTDSMDDDNDDGGFSYASVGNLQTTEPNGQNYVRDACVTFLWCVLCDECDDACLN